MSDTLADVCTDVPVPENGRVVCADIAALDQTLVYNRFGSFNPYGMIFALRRDIVPNTASENEIDAEFCSGLSTAPDAPDDLAAGQVRLRDCKRPRPVVLRVNVGDTLVVRVSNLLMQPEAPDFSHDFCGDTSPADEGRKRVRIGVREGDASQIAHGEADCLNKDDDPLAADAGTPDWPRTRLANFVVQGLHPVPLRQGEPVHDACLGLDAIAPAVSTDTSFWCRYEIAQEGTYFFASSAAPAGGEGDGGSIVHGLFGAVLAEHKGARWYRSQITRAGMDAAWAPQTNGKRHARTGQINYEAVDLYDLAQTADDPAETTETMTDSAQTNANGAQSTQTKPDAATANAKTAQTSTQYEVPILNMARPLDPGLSQAEFDQAGHLELVHSDLNAIIWCNDTLAPEKQDCRAGTDGTTPTTEPGYHAFREFSVFFHDELKTFYTGEFRELGEMGQLAGVRDGFAINYGASGMGTLLLANRKGIGPAAGCMECLYEEFFLTSWANGDPALLEWYADDPSNVHHSYLNDPIVFRNFHAGPKETHVFHLHAHQWFAGNDPDRGSYLDSQTVGPQQGFTYNIYHGGLRGENGTDKGWWDTQGAGNRNRTIGDSIFHCHLYPHFAQGMWELWRVHDVFEDGTRLLPDGQLDAGLSLDIMDQDDFWEKRTGSVDRISGAWIEPSEDAANGAGKGTPIPALVPLPGEPLPLLPTYAEADSAFDDAPPMPGYPFYIAGQPGHRPPQAPLDIARDLGGNPGLKVPEDIDAREPGGGNAWLNAGLDRHIVGDMSERTPGVSLPQTVIGDGGTLVPPETLSGERRSALAAQMVAKAFALGDLSAHLEHANIERISPWGSPLERAAMGFHFDGKLYQEGGGSGAALNLATIDGAQVPPGSERGSYASLRAPVPAGSPSTQPAAFYVNGSPPKPGAPFSDPCGTARSTQSGIADPLVKGWLGGANFMPDPKLDGFRRFEASAVQLDLVVNRAGWHDPQARINVLTAVSDDYKNGPAWRISPVISDREEPFFFRALSGECLEFRHTNELPKDLELDDFQVKTPTDTIGQHIHLVKFDVTSSDGSGNGWNYEDGTLAADEVATRLCAWAATGDDEAETIVADLGAAAHAALPAEFPGTDFCQSAPVTEHRLWRLERSKVPFLFQTTVQRWFADPILSNDGQGAVDRTMRTVFTHDHFGPSSIQQHGFYAALVVEPPARPKGDLDANVAEREDWYPRILPPKGDDGDRPLTKVARQASVAWGGKAWEGARKRVIVQPSPADAAKDDSYFEHPNYREYALSIADFALLYDPRDKSAPGDLRNAVANRTDAMAGSLDGMAKLYCEAYWRLSPALLGSVCGTQAERDPDGWFFPGELPPAWPAGGAHRDDIHLHDYVGDMFLPWAAHKPEVRELGDYLVAYRQKAAGTWRPDSGNAQAPMARPVAAPERPESISVDHHDPYLVNYRGAPIPLRIGTKDPTGAMAQDCAPKQMFFLGDPANDTGGGSSSEVVEALENGSFGQCSFTYQKTDQDGGDVGQALSSHVHGDPETPLIEGYQGERVVIRMIQGAQEVQHTFNIAGQPFKRNIDQHWFSGSQPLGLSADWKANPTLQQRCYNRPVFQPSPVWPPTSKPYADPRHYRAWANTARANWAAKGIDADIWGPYEDALAECDNIEGFAFAQEIGISEHFEMQGALRADVPASLEASAQPVEGDEVFDAEGVPLHSADYLYSFGTVDALWNGAWGLARIYDGITAPDLGSMDGSPPQIDVRLDRLPDFPPEESAASGAETFGSQSGLACPLPGSAQFPSVRVVDTTIIAARMRDVFPDQKGTIYGEELYDPNGLFLAMLSPTQLGLVGIEDEDYGILTPEIVLEAIRTAYDSRQPEPFVLRVRAGDCLRMRMINLLGHGDGNPDMLGDAIMPKIVPLNTDPIPHMAEDAPSAGAQEVGLLERPEGAPGGVRASSQLALSLGLPQLDLVRAMPLGFGRNRAALDGRDGIAVSEPLVAFAGRFRLELPSDATDVQVSLRDAARDKLSDRLLGGGDAAPAADLLLELCNDIEAQDRGLAGCVESLRIVEDASDPPMATILGQGSKLIYRYENEDGDVVDEAVTPAGIAPMLQRALTEALDDKTHWIPYAFGAVPVRPVADVISQGTHGLFGAIDVVPRSWTAVSDPGLRCDPVDADGYERCSAEYVRAQGPGQGMLWSATSGEEGETGVPLREFVLFWRDGMNLWDDRTKTPWRWDDGASVQGTMVPDCPVCDDSYDRGEAGVSHHAPSFSRLLQSRVPAADTGAKGTIWRSDDLNAFAFPGDYMAAATEKIVLQARPGEQIVIRVVHPGGRARQRAFVMNGYTYDDLFPGFGFPRSALLAPGKAISAWLRPFAETGTVVWHDGPAYLRAAGTWGLLDVKQDVAPTE